MDDSWDDELIAELIEDGSIEQVYTDDDGVERIKFNHELLEILHPAIYEAAVQAQLDEVERDLSSLVDKGLVEMTFEPQEDGSLETFYGLTDYGREYVESMGLTEPQ